MISFECQKETVKWALCLESTNNRM
jgi:hypothetical protein